MIRYFPSQASVLRPAVLGHHGPTIRRRANRRRGFFSGRRSEHAAPFGRQRSGD